VPAHTALTPAPEEMYLLQIAGQLEMGLALGKTAKSACFCGSRRAYGRCHGPEIAQIIALL